MWIHREKKGKTKEHEARLRGKRENIIDLLTLSSFYCVRFSRQTRETNLRTYRKCHTATKRTVIPWSSPTHAIVFVSLLSLPNGNPKKVSLKRINKIRLRCVNEGRGKNAQLWHKIFPSTCLPRFGFMTQIQMGEYLVCLCFFSLLPSFHSVHLPEKSLTLCCFFFVLSFHHTWE